MASKTIAVIDNDLYDRSPDIWWSEDVVGALLRHISILERGGANG
jgi:hypothetical protein